MFTNQLLTMPKITQKSYDVTFENGLDTLSSKYDVTDKYKCQYNMTLNNKSLYSSYGIDKLNTIDGQSVAKLDNARAVWYFDNGKGGEYVIHASDNKLYKYDLTTKEVTGLTYIAFDKQFSVRYFDNDGVKAMAFVAKDTFLIYRNDYVEQLPTPDMSIVTIHNERLFGANGTDDTLHFSKPMDITNWVQAVDKAGYLQLADSKGKIVALVSYDDYLYVFKEYGIVRVTTSFDQQAFEVEQVEVDTGTVYQGSVTCCGKYIYFLSSNGLYRFDGNKSENVMPNLNGLFNKTQQNCKSVYLDGKYYLACKANFDDNTAVLCEKYTHTNNALFVLDIVNSKYTILRGVDIVDIVIDNHARQIVLTVNYQQVNTLALLTDSGMYFDKALPKVYESGVITFDKVDSVKFLDNITLYTKYDIALSVVADGKTHTKYISGIESIQKIPLKVSGKHFVLKICTTQPKVQATIYSIAYCLYS